jgi:hypothetical protein
MSFRKGQDGCIDEIRAVPAPRYLRPGRCIDLRQIAGNCFQKIGAGDNALQRAELVDHDRGVDRCLPEQIERTQYGGRFVHGQGRTRDLFHVRCLVAQHLIQQVLLAHDADDLVD